MSEYITKKEAICIAFFEMEKDFNIYRLYDRAKEIIKARCKPRKGKQYAQGSENGIAATLRKHCAYTVIDSNEGHYRKVV